MKRAEVLERVAHADNVIRGPDGEPLPPLTREQWVNTLMVKLGEAAYHARYCKGGAAVKEEGAGPTIEAVEAREFNYAMEAISAVAQHALEQHG